MADSSVGSQRLYRGAVTRIVRATTFMLCLTGCADRDRVGTDGSPWFTEEAAARGIDFHHQSGQSGKDEPLMFPDIMGAGAALVDVDGDGDLDAYLVQGGSLSGPRPGGDKLANRLYFNQGGGQFVAALDPGAAADRGYGMGVTLSLIHI